MIDSLSYRIGILNGSTKKYHHQSTHCDAAVEFT